MLEASDMRCDPKFSSTSSFIATYRLKEATTNNGEAGTFQKFGFLGAPQAQSEFSVG